MKNSRRSSPRGNKTQYLAPTVRELKFNFPEKIDEETLRELICVLTTSNATS